MNSTIKNLIIKLARKWSIDEVVLFEIYHRYTKYAESRGDLAALARLMGYTLNPSKVAYLIKKIRKNNENT